MTHHESQSMSDSKEKQQNKDANSGEMRQKAQQTAQQATEMARDAAGEVAHQAKDEARSMVETGKSQVTSELHSMAEAFRTTSRQLGDNSELPVARYANTIADRLEDATSYLEGHNIDAILADAEEFARQQPELFLGGAFGVGLLISRFFKSSSRNGGNGYSPSRYGSGQYNRGAMNYGPGRGSSDWQSGQSGSGDVVTRSATSGPTTRSTASGSGAQGAGALGTEVNRRVQGGGTPDDNSEDARPASQKGGKS